MEVQSPNRSFSGAWRKRRVGGSIGDFVEGVQRPLRRVDQAGIEVVNANPVDKAGVTRFELLHDPCHQVVEVGPERIAKDALLKSGIAVRNIGQCEAVFDSRCIAEEFGESFDPVFDQDFGLPACVISVQP